MDTQLRHVTYYLSILHVERSITLNAYYLCLSLHSRCVYNAQQTEAQLSVTNIGPTPAAYHHYVITLSVCTLEAVV